MIFRYNSSCEWVGVFFVAPKNNQTLIYAYFNSGLYNIMFRPPDPPALVCENNAFRQMHRIDDSHPTNTMANESATMSVVGGTGQMDGVAAIRIMQNC